jgi:hypothetical protein
MPDWMDELRDSLADDERRRKEAEERDRSIDMGIGFALGQIFDALQKSVETSIPILNHRLFGDKQGVVFGYEDNMITGDHFLITSLPLRYFVNKVSNQQQIECRLKEGSHPDWNWVPVDNGARDLIVSTDGQRVFQTQDMKRETVDKIEQVTERLLSTIVHAAAAIKRDRPPARPPFFIQ